MGWEILLWWPFESWANGEHFREESREAKEKQDTWSKELRFSWSDFRRGIFGS